MSPWRIQLKAVQIHVGIGWIDPEMDFSRTSIPDHNLFIQNDYAFREDRSHLVLFFMFVEQTVNHDCQAVDDFILDVFTFLDVNI